MRTQTITRTINTTCGKIISYFQKDGEVAKMHSMEGPALIYPKEEKKASEYFIYGIKYSKSKWQELVNQQKVVASTEPTSLEF